MVSTALDPQTSTAFHHRMVVRLAIRIKPGVSPHLLRRAFDKVVSRHDSLRLRFVLEGKEWMAEILRRHTTGLNVEDCGRMSKLEQQAVIHQRTESAISVFSDALFEMRLLKFGSEGDVLLIQAHHAIIDGYGVVLLLEELFRTATGASIEDKSVSHSEFITYRRRQLQDIAAEKDAYWQNAMFPLPGELNIGRAAMGLPPVSNHTVNNTVRFDRFLNRHVQQTLADLTIETGISSYAFLHSAFSDTLCESAVQDEVVVCSTVGRRDAALSTFVGMEFDTFTIKYVRTRTGIRDAARQVERRFREALHHFPTNSFEEGSPISRAFEQAKLTHLRFYVHMPIPSGRLSASIFGNTLQDANAGPTKIGPISVERIEVPTPADTDFEIELSIMPIENGHQASIFADAAAWKVSDVEQIAGKIQERIQGV
jgi:hypothetical protein